MIIGISGKKRGGKSTVVDIISKMLHQKTEEPVFIVRFADFLKEIVIKCFCPAEWELVVDDLDVEETKNKVTPCGKTVRVLLQEVGTDKMRGIWENCWANCFSNTVHGILREYPNANILCPDVRFPNELWMIQEQYKGIVLRTMRAPHSGEDQHASETALDETEANTLAWCKEFWPTGENPPLGMFNAIIDNTETTILELYDIIVTLMEQFGVVEER